MSILSLSKRVYNHLYLKNHIKELHPLKIEQGNGANGAVRNFSQGMESIYTRYGIKFLVDNQYFINSKLVT